jgi:hypothetical protein
MAMVCGRRLRHNSLHGDGEFVRMERTRLANLLPRRCGFVTKAPSALPGAQGLFG